MPLLFFSYELMSDFDNALAVYNTRWKHAVALGKKDLAMQEHSALQTRMQTYSPYSAEMNFRNALMHVERELACWYERPAHMFPNNPHEQYFLLERGILQVMELQAKSLLRSAEHAENEHKENLWNLSCEYQMRARVFSTRLHGVRS